MNHKKRPAVNSRIASYSAAIDSIMDFDPANKNWKMTNSRTFGLNGKITDNSW